MQRTREFVWLCIAATTAVSACGEQGIERSARISDAPAIMEPTLVDSYDRGRFIVGGDQDAGHLSVGELQSGNSACTATLVGTRMVLTAGHCVSSGPVTFILGTTRYPAEQVTRHPAYGGANTNDLALVRLSQAPAVAPAPINVDLVSVGQSIIVVGYGLTGENSGTFGVKRFGQNSLSQTTATTFSFTGTTNVCNGDSGGPTFVNVNGQERVIGVHSTKRGICGYGGTDMRVDAYRDWLTQASNGDIRFPDGSKPQPQPNPQPQPQPQPGGQCGMTAEEASVFQLMNQERAKVGARALTCDAAMVKVVRAHSQDMCVRGYFDHYTPEGLAPWNRLKAGGVSFRGAGENVAMGYRSAAAVNQGWMTSPGHRDNRLNPSWLRYGAGYVYCGGRPYWTEAFVL